VILAGRGVMNFQAMKRLILLDLRFMADQDISANGVSGTYPSGSRVRRGGRIGIMASGKHINRLSAREVATASKPGLYADGGNLYLKVDDGGAKSWIFRRDIGGRTRKYGLGPTHTVSLADARKRAEEARRMLDAGVDPREAKRAERAAAAVADAKAITFDKAVAAYIESRKAGWKNAKHAAQWAATLKTYASPHFGKLPVAAIDTGMVMRALGPIWTTKTETAGRVRGRIERVLDWAKVHGYRDGPNPAQWHGHLDHLLPARSKVRRVEHHAALPYAELPAFMIDLRKREAIAARAMEFCILTATRTSETLDATWDEFDIPNQLWTIPEARMKGGVLHKVPLSNRAVAIIEAMRQVSTGKFVFPGHRPGRALSNMAMLTVLRRMKRDNITVHGFRSSFRDWATEVAKVREVVAEAALAHGVKDKSEAAYRRATYLDERVSVMQRWANYCDTRTESGKVVALR
jgi:integrase